MRHALRRAPVEEQAAGRVGEGRAEKTRMEAEEARMEAEEARMEGRRS